MRVNSGGGGRYHDGRKLHCMLNAASAPVMSREHYAWTHLTASGQSREQDSSGEDMSDC